MSGAGGPDNPATLEDIMRTYTVGNKVSGATLGNYEAESAEEAIRLAVAEGDPRATPSPDLAAVEVDDADAEDDNEHI